MALNMLQLSAIFNDKASSILYLQQRGVLYNPRMCLNCRNPMILQLREKGDRWRCSLRGCRAEIGLRKDTWLQNSNLLFRKVVLFIYCWSKEQTSIEFCKTELEISKNTSVDWNNFMREVCAADLLANPVVIGGPNTTVEVDERPCFLEEKIIKGACCAQQWVFGGICRETRDSFMFTVPDRSAPTLLPIIQASIRPGTTIMSDLWAAYGGIQAMGYAHLTVNHTYNFVDPVTNAHTQNVENSWKNAKRRNKKTARNTSRHA